MTQLFTAEYDPKTYEYLGSGQVTHWYCPVCITRHPLEEVECDHVVRGTASKYAVWKRQ